MNSHETDVEWKKDETTLGKATCPKCGTLLRYGTAGVANLVKTHENKQSCLDAKAKRDREKARRKDGNMLSFFKKAPLPQHVPSTVDAPRPVASGSSGPKHNPAKITPQSPVAPLLSTSVPSSHIIRLLNQFRGNVVLLPSTVPTADDTNPLSAFSSEPATYVDAKTKRGELWEALAPVFHGVFDYGGTQDARIALVQRGPLGLHGLLRFLEYFIVERGLEGAMIELKIEQMIEAVQFVLKSNGITGLDLVDTPVDHRALDIIDVDAVVESVSLSDAAQSQRHAGSKSVQPCAGFLYPFGGSARTAGSDYPYGLHAALPLPWTYTSTVEGTLTLRSTNCRKTAESGRLNCAACAELPRNTILAGILDRAKYGTAENSNYAYHTFAGLVEIIRRKNKRIEELRVRALNSAKRIAVQARALSDHKRFLRAIGSGNVENVDRLVRVQLGRRQGIRGLLATYDQAAKGFYHPKSYTEEDHLRGVLIWRMAGNRVADFAHRAFGTPSRTTLGKNTTVPPIIPSPGKPASEEVAKNVSACFQGLADVLADRKPRHAVLMFDEISTERRVRWDSKTNNFLGVCREHAHKISLQFNSEQDLEELFRCKDADEVHFAGEATVAAIGVLDDHTRLYAARPILISGDCKKESGVEHLHSWPQMGETRRGKAFVELTFRHKLSPDSPIYPLLKDLPLMNFWVGDDDLTADKDHKHVFKRGRNRLIRLRGTMVFGVQITPTIIRVHLQATGSSAAHINSVLRPDDKQDVKLSFELLMDLWALPPAPNTASPGFMAARNALIMLGSLFYHLIFPYVCIDLSLSEQLEHLSAAAHLALVLYRDGEKEAIPTLLYVDIMIMIKNAYFCVAKAKVDDPLGNFWLILLGTDRLEELFGILRTVIGNDRNLDVLQLVERITGTMEIANILAMYPHWDRAPRRLKLPALSRDSKVLPDRTDHIKPPSWRADTCVANVTPLTSWNRGRRMVVEEFPSLVEHFKALDDAYNIDILAPLGEFLINKELDEDDNENDDDEEVPDLAPTKSLATDLEDAAVDEDVLLASLDPPAFTNFITVNNQQLRKTRALAQMQKFGYKASSTDRLKRVADVERYSSKAETYGGIVNDDEPYILLSEPIATLIRCDDKLFVAIGEVADIRLHSKSIEQLSIDILRERKVTVSFQILSLVPATTEDDPEHKHDWRSAGTLRPLLTAPGRLVVPVDPALSTRVAGKPYFLFDSTILQALGAQLLDEVTLQLNKQIPKLSPTTNFPYRESTGRACFVCEGDNEVEGLAESDAHTCCYCDPPFPLDITRPQKVLAHTGAHILHDSKIDRSSLPCGFCGRPAPMCLFFLKKTHSAGEGMTVNMALSKGCPNFVKAFKYVTAEKSSSKQSPCSNVPLRCPECDSTEPAQWRYNLKYHLMRDHPLTPLKKYAHLWGISETENDWMLEVSNKSNEVRTTRVKKVKSSLIISAAHSSKPTTI
ncbi:hypothetical protein MSAN_02488500 [Mycena sanguinolenta]|uniref:Uncharacterized protein n=1 Tax=Mycena sanguinolenta TaxID=230812 RepID=A0A8H6WSH7_9AGAR|nr:hypothetical protein MSAN_02488500 [Mycena sanguinolenta]